MKTKLTIFLTAIMLSGFSCTLFAQPWQASGNSASSGDFVGTTNSIPLLFKVNNTQEIAILTSGTVQVSSFAGGGTGIATYDGSGNLIPLNFSGSSTDVLTGTGTFTSISSLTYWKLKAGTVYDSGTNVGINTSHSDYPLTVNGTALINGNLFAQSVIAQSALSIGGFSIVNGAVDTITSTSGTMQLNSTRVNISGTLQANDITVNDTLVVPVIRSHRIALFPGDSIIHFGDSSIAFNMNTNNIYGTQGTRYSGIGLGCGNNTSGTVPHYFETSVAIGCMNVLPYLQNSIAIGNTDSLTANNAIAIGYRLKNTITGSIMMGGYNSTGNIPALSIIPDMTHGTAGFVGIGTTAPTYPLDVKGIARANEVKVCVFGTCDFVFDKDYKLMPLLDLENYLHLNLHLPGIPPAAEMESGDGVALGEMNSKLLLKVEELTLYDIQLKKQLDEQEKKLADLEAKMNALH